MGLLSGVVEEVLQVATSGRSDFFGITGEGGLIHDKGSDAVIALDDEGVNFLQAEVRLPWAGISELKNDGEWLDITHIGGLGISIPSGLVVYYGDEDEILSVANLKMQTEGESVKVYFDPIKEMILGNEDEDVDNIKSKIDGLEVAACDLQLAKELYDMINGGVSIIITVGSGLGAVHNFFFNLWLLKTAETHATVSGWVYDHEELLREMTELANFWGEQIADDCEDVDDESRDLLNSIYVSQLAEIKYWSSYTLLEDGDYDDAGYALARTAFCESDLEDEDEWLEWFDKKFAARENAKKRKVIVCSDSPCALRAVGTVLDEIAVVDARHLEKVLDLQKAGDPLETIQGQREAARISGNDIPMAKAKQAAEEYKRDRESRRLSFEQGHPQNGCVYIQHPLDVNTYVDIEQFHATMLERKYNELIRILVALGARTVKCSVENHQNRDEKWRSRQQGAVEAQCIAGSAGGNGSGENVSSRVLSLSKKLNTELKLHPNEKPHLPGNLIYYPFEDGWKQVVENVLSGRLLTANIDLSYSKDYAITGRFVKNLGAKIESLLPMYQFSANGSYESEVENELRELESIVWHYEVDFCHSADKAEGGETAKEDSVDDSQPNETAPKNSTQNKNPGQEDTNRVENVILKRARQFAKTDGVDLSENHRKQLFDMGAKYGVDELRIEELIADACE